MVVWPVRGVSAMNALISAPRLCVLITPESSISLLSKTYSTHVGKNVISFSQTKLCSALLQAFLGVHTHHYALFL